jgi:hypothetical protein
MKQNPLSFSHIKGETNFCGLKLQVLSVFHGVPNPIIYGPFCYFFKLCTYLTQEADKQNIITSGTGRKDIDTTADRES